MRVTKIYTESVNYNAMLDVCDVLFPGGYTVYDGIGSYDGKREGTFIVELWDAENDKVQAFARWCTFVNKQNQVDIISYEAKRETVTHE